MSLVYRTGTIILGLETFDWFFVVFTRLSETFNGVLSGIVLNGIVKVDWLLGICEVCPVMNRYAKLFPEALPIQNVAVERGHLDFPEFSSSCLWCHTGLDDNCGM